MGKYIKKFYAVIKKRTFRNRKNLCRVIALIAFIVAAVWALIYFTRNKDGINLPITEGEYHTYDDYGLSFTEEASVYETLGQLLPIDLFEPSLEVESRKSYVYSDIGEYRRYKTLLSKAFLIRTIGYVESLENGVIVNRSYIIDYIDKSGDRIFLEYFEDGKVIKTIADVEDGRIVAVSNHLVKDILYTKLLDENALFHSEKWQAIEGKEFMSYDSWAGSAIYFQRIGNYGYATFMIYGSGIAVISHHTSIVTMDENGLLHVEVPAIYTQATKPYDDKTEMIDIELIVDSGQIKIGEALCNAQDEVWGYKMLQEMYDSGWFDLDIGDHSK